MAETKKDNTSRRDFLKKTGQIAAATTLVAGTVPHVHAAEDNTIQVALVGCGGRGSGAAANALSVKNGPTKLVAMADVFENRLKTSHKSLSGRYGSKVDVTDDRKFISFEGYKHAIDCLRPGDVVILTTPPAFRWVHFTYAIEKGINVFMEKPVTVDGPSTRRMLELDKKAKAKDLKVAVGLMCRHCLARNELADKIHNGEIGDVLMLRAYRIASWTGSAAAPAKPDDLTELMHQIKHFHGFLWLSGGAVSDFLIHNIDEGCWAKGAWPIKAQASGGRHYHITSKGDPAVDQNFDTYSIEYSFEDGTKLLVNGRTIPGCHNQFATYVHGSKGSAIFSTSGHRPAKSRIFKGQNFVQDELVWSYPAPEPNPYQVEWDDLVNAIRKNEPYSEVERGAMASVVTSMGRMAAHTGQEITLDQMLNCEHEFAPNVDQLSLESESPLKANAEGKYPVPMPGIIKDREYV